VGRGGRGCWVRCRCRAVSVAQQHPAFITHPFLCHPPPSLNPHTRTQSLKVGDLKDGQELKTVSKHKLRVGVDKVGGCGWCAGVREWGVLVCVCLLGLVFGDCGG